MLRATRRESKEKVHLFCHLPVRSFHKKFLKISQADMLLATTKELSINRLLKEKSEKQKVQDKSVSESNM